ncbi:NAD-binding protein [candidate division KSB1 bacterium]|nr:NAD-binding protein [candidate division KSB1 bacterium]
MTLIFAIAAVAFLQAGMIGLATPWKFFQAMYYALSLFFLGGVDIGAPAAPSQWLNVTLWICYFLAPLLTFSFIFVIIQEKLLSNLLPWVKNHTIICGAGRNGILIYQLLKEHAKRGKVVIIEKNKDNAYGDLLEKDPATLWIRKSFLDMPVLQKARLNRAKQIYLSTNMSLVNLNALINVLEILGTEAQTRVYCHIDDVNLHANMSATLLKEKKFSHVSFFNGYQSVTKRLYENWIVEKGYLSPATIFIIFGVGKFGRMLLAHIVNDPRRTMEDEVIILTRCTNDTLDQLNYMLEKQLPRRCTIHQLMNADMDNPKSWDLIASRLSGKDKRTLCFLCRDDDLANLNLAITMKRGAPKKLREAIYICRMYSEMAHELDDILERRITETQAADIILFPLQRELKEAFRAELFPGGRAASASARPDSPNSGTPLPEHSGADNAST